MDDQLLLVVSTDNLHQEDKKIKVITRHEIHDHHHKLYDLHDEHDHHAWLPAHQWDSPQHLR